MKLSSYMAMADIKDSDMARQLGVDRSTVTKLRLGKSKPSFDLLIAIQRLTDNAVTAGDFAEVSK